MQDSCASECQLVLHIAPAQNARVENDSFRALSAMHDFTLVVLEGAYGSTVAATLDMLIAAASLSQRVGSVAPRWRVCSLRGGPVVLGNGTTVATTLLRAQGGKERSVWLVPGLGTTTSAALDRRLMAEDAQRIVVRLRRHVAEGGQVAASCSAVFLLAAAGLLRDRRATTAWWLAPTLQKHEPRCRVDADRMICADGPVVTAGAAFAHIDLMLHVLRERFGAALVEALSRMLLLDGRAAQAPFIVPEVLANGNELVGRVALRVEAALPRVPAISALAREFCLSERTLSRHIYKATGKTTQALVQSIRLRSARRLLETTRMTVDQVAEAVGYRDSTALRRLMMKRMGANPSAYRPATAAI
jgi:transcriptional regulator GlxA family with amidase domain